MDITVKGKNMDVGDALRGHVVEQLEGIVTKYFTQALDANVMFSREGHRIYADIKVHPGPRGMVVQSRCEGGDAYGCFDGSLERIAKQLRRYKRRLNNHHKDYNPDILPAQQYILQPETQEDEVPENSEPVIIAEMETMISTLTVSEAVMRMDLAHAPIMMFRNDEGGELNVVYRREDGNIGWIDPVPG